MYMHLFLLWCCFTLSACTLDTPEESGGNYSPDFLVQDAYLQVLPEVYTPRGKMLMLPADDKKAIRVYAMQDSLPVKKIVVLFHDWWGLTDQVKLEAERWHDSLKLPVLAIDLFDSVVAETPAQASLALKKMKQDRIENILRGLHKYIGNEATVATIGWSSGVNYSLLFAQRLGHQVSACIAYYGPPPAGEQVWASIKAPILLLSATQDQWMTPKMCSDWVSRANALGKKVVQEKLNADHAFANPVQPGYEPMAAAKAWKTAIAFLRANSF